MTRKKDIPRPRCSGTMTEAGFITFVKNQLRGATRKWKPIADTLKEARVGHGVYRCNGFERESHNVPVTVVINKKRIKNVFVDHCIPVIDPSVGFTSWNDYINRLYSESDNLQLLCGDCHDKKTMKERTASTERRRKEKED